MKESDQITVLRNIINGIDLVINDKSFTTYSDYNKCHNDLFSNCVILRANYN